jgi:Holliday junction resolvase RusA-like endonuclease
MHLVAYRSGEAYDGPIVTRAVIVQVVFFVKRPKNHWKKDGSLSAEGKRCLFPTKRSAGDLDKLLRAVLDGLTGQVYADDSQVIGMWPEKRYQKTPTFPTGALIRVYVWDPPDGPSLREAP